MVQEDMREWRPWAETIGHVLKGVALAPGDEGDHEVVVDLDVIDGTGGFHTSVRVALDPVLFCFKREIQGRPQSIARALTSPWVGTSLSLNEVGARIADDVFESSSMSPQVKTLNVRLGALDPRERLVALYALIQLGQKARPAFAECLRVLAHDPDVEARAQAAEALGEMFSRCSDTPVTRAVLAALRLALDDEVWHVRYLAAEALGRFGSRASSFLEPLQALASDREPRVRSAAAYAVGRISNSIREP